MIYKLAKQLKDGGFPKEREWIDPTLSELIEACGEDADFKLQYFHNIKKWVAEMKGKLGTGYPPEEAVAKLWLELNNL